MTHDDHSVLLLSELRDHIAVAQVAGSVLARPFVRLVGATIAALRQGNKILLFGNGGSAADAQHWATELTVRYRVNRPALAALALTTDSSALTAIGNDFGFEQVFARQIEALARPGDIAIGISTSGSSPNVVAGLVRARALGCATVGFTGNDGGRLAGIVDIALIVPSSSTARIQELHVVLAHALCEAIEADLSSNGLP